MRTLAPLFFLVTAVSAHSADIGGWIEQQQRQQLTRDDCAELPARAARIAPDAPNAAQTWYATGLCYLDGERLKRDPVAAAAWFTKAADLGHPLARRALLALRP
jgi:TPR repeat protein